MVKDLGFGRLPLSLGSLLVHGHPTIESIGENSNHGPGCPFLLMDFLEPEIDEPKPKSEARPPVETREQKEKIKAEKKIKKSIFESGDISSFSPSQLSALFQKHTKKAFPTLSDIELKDLAIPGTSRRLSLFYIL